MEEIDAATRITGIIAWPVKHSLSPAMHNAAYADLGMNWLYLGFPVESAFIAQAVYGIRALGLVGVNVTIPHKETVIPYLDELTPAARAIGAVNTIVVDAGHLIGENTDVYGFLEALRQGGVHPDGQRALVLGAGGAARAAAYGLLTGGAEVFLLSRTPARSHQLSADMRASVPNARMAVVDSAPQSVDLLVNCTPVGMMPVEQQSPLPANVVLDANAAVMDMVYRPMETLLIRQARQAGARVIGGLDMLVYQGVAAFERWTGRRPSPDVMRAACLQALHEKSE